MNLAKHKLRQFGARVREAQAKKATWDIALRDALLLTFNERDWVKSVQEAELQLEGLKVRVTKLRQEWHWHDDVVEAKASLEFNGVKHEFGEQASRALWAQSQGKATRVHCDARDKSRANSKVNKAAALLMTAIGQGVNGKA